MNFMTAEVVIDVNLTRVTSDFRRAERLATQTIRNVERTHLRMIRDTERASRAAARASVAFHRRVDRIIRRTYRNMTRAATRAFASIKRAAKIAAAAFLAVGVASVKMAMDAEESENLFEVSMGKMARATRKWSDELSTALGLNAFEVRKTVGTFNVMFTSMGLNAEAARDMAQGLTMLTQDMASFFNLRPEEAFQKLQAGITGESEPLKRLGILVNETTTKVYAMANGIGNATGKLTEQQKVLARYGLILKQTTMAQGDMERTLDSTTNVFRSLWSRIQEVAIGIGNKLLPAVTKVAIRMRDWLTKNQKQIEEWAGVFVKKIEWVIEKMKDLWAVFQGKGFGAGVKTFLRSLLPAFNAIIDSFVIAGIAAGKAFWEGVIGRQPTQHAITTRKRGELAPGAPLIWQAGDRDRIIGELRKIRITKEIGLVEKLKSRWEGVGTAMAAAIPSRPSDPTARKFIGDQPFVADPGETLRMKDDAARKQAVRDEINIRQELQSMIEGHFNTLQGGTLEEMEHNKIIEDSIRLTAARATILEKMNADNLAQAKAGIEHIQSLNFLSHTERLIQMDELIEVKRALWAEEGEAMALLAEERQRYADQHKEGWDALRQTMNVWFQDASNWGKNLGDVLTNSFDRAAESFASMLMKQKADWKAFSAMFVQELLTMIVKLQIAMVLKAALQGWSGLAPSMGQTGTGGTGAITPGISEALDTGFAGGGSVLQTGIVKVHKGEEIVSANQVGGLTINIENNAGVQVDVEENPDERTYNVILTAMAGDGQMRRAVKQAAR